jgi:Bacterial extracellular solute-binding proteins, family 5 Middle
MKAVITTISIIVVLAAAGLLYWFVFRKDLSDKIIIPYIAHQKPQIDPHVPHAVPLTDKLDEVLFDGLFNVSANASGITYDDGLGEFLGIDKNSVVTIRLKPNQKWHNSYSVTMKKDKMSIDKKEDLYFTPKDLKFTLERIQKLGSLSPDYILVSQAVSPMDFTGPNADNQIKFQFRTDRQWSEGDIKEVLSFKILPANSAMDAPSYTVGTGPYLLAGEYEDVIFFHKIPDGTAHVTNVVLKPFIDNSTYTTELKNKNINTLLSTPFGSISPILSDSTAFFHKSSIATCFFALFNNCDRLNIAQRKALRKLVNSQMILDRFFKTHTQQQRHIANYAGPGDNYDEYLNYSVFPTTSYYVSEKIVVPPKEQAEGDLAALPDTVRIQTCLNYDFREELSDLMAIMNDPVMFHGKIKVTAVSNDEIRQGNYDAVLVPISGYRSNFLFDLYNIFLREPDFGTYSINLKTHTDEKGKLAVDESCFTASKNFFRVDLGKETPERADLAQLLNYVYGFMSTREIGDKQAYSQFIDQLDQKLALGVWLFSLPSLAYMSTQFDDKTVDMYGTASQLSTIEKWQERPKK